MENLASWFEISAASPDFGEAPFDQPNVWE